MPEETKKSRRGFASMDPARQREIASKGGKSAHAQGRAHKWTASEAREAGKRGGSTHSSEHMSEIGRVGGAHRGEAMRRSRAAREVHDTERPPPTDREPPAGGAAIGGAT